MHGMLIQNVMIEIGVGMKGTCLPFMKKGFSSWVNSTEKIQNGECLLSRINFASHFHSSYKLFFTTRTSCIRRTPSQIIMLWSRPRVVWFIHLCGSSRSDPFVFETVLLRLNIWWGRVSYQCPNAGMANTASVNIPCFSWCLWIDSLPLGGWYHGFVSLSSS